MEILIAIGVIFLLLFIMWFFGRDEDKDDYRGEWNE